MIDLPSSRALCDGGRLSVTCPACEATAGNECPRGPRELLCLHSRTQAARETGVVRTALSAALDEIEALRDALIEACGIAHCWVDDSDLWNHIVELRKLAGA